MSPGLADGFFFLSLSHLGSPNEIVFQLEVIRNLTLAISKTTPLLTTAAAKKKTCTNAPAALLSLLLNVWKFKCHQLTVFFYWPFYISLYFLDALMML